MMNILDDHFRGGPKDPMASTLEEIFSSSSRPPSAAFLERLRARLHAEIQNPDSLRAILDEPVDIPPSLLLPDEDTETDVVTELLKKAASEPPPPAPEAFVRRLMLRIAAEPWEKPVSSSAHDVSADVRRVTSSRSTEERPISALDTLLERLPEAEPLPPPPSFMAYLLHAIEGRGSHPERLAIIEAEDVEGEEYPNLTRDGGSTRIDDLLHRASQEEPPPAPEDFTSSLLLRIRGEQDTLKEAESLIHDPHSVPKRTRQYEEDVLHSAVEPGGMVREDSVEYYSSRPEAVFCREELRAGPPPTPIELASDLRPFRQKDRFWKSPAFAWGLSIAATIFVVFTIAYQFRNSSEPSRTEEFARNETNTERPAPSPPPRAEEPLPAGSSETRTIPSEPTSPSSPDNALERAPSVAPIQDEPALMRSTTRGSEPETTVDGVSGGQGTGAAPTLAPREVLSKKTIGQDKVQIIDSVQKRKQDSLRRLQKDVPPSAPKETPQKRIDPR